MASRKSGDWCGSRVALKLEGLKFSSVRVRVVLGISNLLPVAATGACESGTSQIDRMKASHRRSTSSSGSLAESSSGTKFRSYCCQAEENGCCSLAAYRDLSAS